MQSTKKGAASFLLAMAASVATLGLSATAVAQVSNGKPTTPTTTATPNPSGVGGLRSASVPCGDCGTITEVKQTKVKGKATWKGTLGGAAAGGVVGNKVGDSTTSTVIGAVGGAVAGREIEKRMSKKDVYVITVRMDNGSTAQVQKEAKGSWQVGDKVRVTGDSITPR